MNLIEFLRETKVALSSGFQDKVEVHVVIGNESCDLDSAVCSVVLAYFLTLTSGTKDIVFIPVLDIPQQKYHLRTETTFLLRKHGISDELLTFNDQIDLDDLHRQLKLKLSLVDHNILPQKYIGLDDCVVSVTDHRPQVRKQDNRVKINIAKVGSCATLIAEEVFKRTDLTFDPTALTFLYVAILIDTVNLSPAAHKMTDQDVAMADKLKEMLPEVNGDVLYNTIQKAKTDISELTTLELLEKDLKIVSGNSVKVAMSSVSIGLQDFLSRENLMEDLSSFVQSHSVLAVIVMMIHQVTEGEPVRDIAVYSTEMALQQKICDQLSANRDPVLELTVVTTDKQNLTCYKQGCVRASRKVVLPIIQTIVNEYENVISHCEERLNSAEKPLDSIDLFNLSDDQTSQNQFAASVPLDNFDLLNFAGQQSSQSQSETGTNQNLVDEFDIFTGTDTTNNAQINSTDVLNESPLDSQNQLDLNFDLVGTSEQTSQFDSSSNVDLLGGFDPFSSSANNTPIIVNNLPSNIPEINIDSEQATDEFNEADIMFGSQTLETPHSGMNSVSQGSSAHNSEPGSAFASYPITPPNSFIDSTGHAHVKEFVLPSLNSAEMLEKIREKKGRLRSTESTSADGTENDPNSVPYTPSNSYMDGDFDQYAKDHQLPSFNSMEMVQRIKQKRSSMEMSRLDEEDDIVRLRSESGEVTPYTPHNSYRDLSLLEKNYKTFLDTNKLHQTLRNIEDDASEAQQEADEDSLAVKEITDSGLLMFDTSDMLNPTDIDNNVVAVGIAQEMVKKETTSDDLLVSFFDAPSDGGSRLTDSSLSSFDGKPSQDSAKGSNNDNNFQNFESKGGNVDHLQTEDLVLNQSINEFAQNLTENLIENAINSFPVNEIPNETEKEELSATSPVSTEEFYFKENKNLEILESPSSTGSVTTPEEVPVETDYLSSVDPMLGNLDLVKASEEKEIVESISFRKISGEEPQTVRQEILLRHTPDKVDEDTEPKMEESSEPTMDHSNEPKMEESDEPKMKDFNEPMMEDSNEPKMEELDEPKMVESNEPKTKESSEPEIIEPNELKMEEPNEPKMEEPNEPKMEVSNEPMMEDSNEPKMEELDEPKMVESNEPKTEESSEPAIIEPNEPKMEEPNEPKMEEPNEPKMEESNEPNMDHSYEPEMVESNEPEMKESNEMGDSNESEMDHFNELKMEESNEPEMVESNEPKLEEPNGAIDEYAAELIQHVISGAIATVTTATTTVTKDIVSDSSSDITEESGVTWSRETSFDTVSSIPSKDGQTVIWSNQGSLDTPRSSIDKNSGAASLESDELLLLTQSAKNGQMPSFETQESNGYLSSTSSSKLSSDSKIESSDKMEEIFARDLNMDVGNEKELVQSSFNNQSDTLLDFSAGSNLDEHEGNQINNQTLLDFEGSELIQAESLKSEGGINELHNISDKTAVGMESIEKMESVDISSENEVENVSTLNSENAFDELSNIFDKTAIGIENIDKMESVEMSSEKEAENLSPLKSDNAFDELSSTFDKPAIGMENLDKMESVERSSENEAENLSPLKSDNAFDELSSTFDKPAIGMENLDKMESVERSSENEAENLSPLKSDNAFDELSSTFDKPAVGIENEDKTESVDRSSENEAEKLSPLKSDNAFDELSNIFDKPAVGIENEYKTECVEISSENEAENLSPLKSDNAFDELSNIFDKPAVGIENEYKTESVDISSENEPENLSPLKSDNAFDELSSTFDKPAVGIENEDKTESVDRSSENEAEKLSPLKSDNAFDELSNIFDKPAVGIENEYKTESVDISSENEAEKLSPLKSDNAFDELSNIFDKPAVGIENEYKTESVDISSENEPENLSPLKSDNAFDELSNIFDKPAVGIENEFKTESVDISSENEAENLSPMKSDNAFDELSNIFDKPAVGTESIDNMKSVGYISSENEAENMSPLKSGKPFNEFSNITDSSDKLVIGEGNIDKMESVDISFENETENLLPLKTENETENLLPLSSENGFNELSDISDKTAVGMEDIDKMESVDYISSENEAENLLPLKTNYALNEDISDKPANGIENVDRMESVDYISSENEAENFSPSKTENEAENLLSLRSEDAFNELSDISDKTAVGMENIDKMGSVDISSEKEAENMSPLESGETLNELSDITDSNNSDKPVFREGIIDKMESVDYISSEKEAENMLTLKSDAFDELSDIFNKPAIGIENGDKTESVDHTSSENEAENLSLLKSENEAENMLPLKSEDALNEQSSISDKVSIGIENIDKMESLEISSENEAENMSPLKSENIDFLEQSQDSVPYSDRKKESLDYISSEGETDNYGKLQDESEASTQDARSTYHKAETLDYISSEGEGNDTEFVTSLQGMYSSQSSEPTSTTTEGSYQVLSPDQQVKDIKEEITDLINSEIKGEVTADMISDIKMELSGLHPDVFETKANENIEFYAEVTEIDENETDLNKHDEEFISNEDFLAGVSEHSELIGDNLDFSNISSNEPVSEGKEIDENKTGTDLKKYDKEFISNENLLGTVAEDELKGNNVDFSKISSNELVGEGNKIDESETDLNTKDKEVINNENLLGGADEGLNEKHVELKGDNLEFANNSSNEFVGDGNKIDETETETDLNNQVVEVVDDGNEISEKEINLNKYDEELISNESLLVGVAKGSEIVHVELKGDNLEFTNNSSNEFVGDGNEIDENETETDLNNQVVEVVDNGNEISEKEINLNKHDEELISNESLLAGVAKGSEIVHDDLKGDNLEFSNDSLNKFVGEGNEIDENDSDLNKRDEEFVSNGNLLEGEAEGLNEEHVELKGDNLEFSNNLSNKLVGEENEIDENETNLNKHDEKFISNENLLGEEAENHIQVHNELKGDNLTLSNNSSNELFGQRNEIDFNKHDEEEMSIKNSLGAVAGGLNEVQSELKGINLEFSNNSVNEFVGEGNEISEKETDLNKHNEELISNENIPGAETEHVELKGDNSNNSSNNIHIEKSDTHVNDENGINTNENGAIDSTKRTKEIYMTSAGRISIASDGDSENTKQRFSVTDNFIEETHNEVGKLIAEADETLAQADETVFEADTILACIDINPLEENSTYPTTGNALSSINGDFSCMDVFVKEDLKETRVETVDNQLSVENEPETVSKEPENISVETGNQTQEPAGTSEELVNKTQEPVSKSEEPVNNNQELVSKSKEPVGTSEELVNKTQEPVSKLEEPENKTQEPVSKVEELSVKQQEKTDDGTEKPKVVKPVKKGMDMTEEWHEDPIPGMGVTADNDSDSSDSRSRHSSGDSDSSDSTRPANRPTSLQTTRKKKKISANFNILKEDYASPDDIDTTDNPGDLEWENDTPVSIPKEPIAEYSAEDEYQDAKHWRGVEINGKQQKIDLKVIDPYKKVLTHGGYYGDGLNAIIVFSGCYLPDRSRKDYNYVMDNLFLYVISTLELLVAEDYMIVYFHGATPRRQMPSFGWLKKCYQMIDRRLKKNLKGLLLIHPTLWLRTIVLMTKPFISSKFSSKLKFVRTLQDLSNIVPVDYIYIPDEVKKYDSLLQHRSPAHSSSSSTPHTPS
ncbi:uncharacterized protein PF3D7_1120600-like isoform X2 [Mytilus edulis]|uniref:uncharacterized protein PF3D7_1120600-like isoform X2 n=1 Tax=Mytilus edulis TaxID=6550 RepID=UPI0039EF56A1